MYSLFLDAMMLELLLKVFLPNLKLFIIILAWQVKELELELFSLFFLPFYLVQKH